MRILLVECFVSEQQRVLKSLNDAGFEVSVCGDCDLSLRLFMALRPHVVVVGDAMGQRITDGEQLVESIKELDPEQPIVMLRKSDAQLLLEVSAHKQRLPLFPFDSESP